MAKTKVKAATKPTVSKPPRKRVRETARHTSFKLSSKHVKVTQPISGVRQLLRVSLRLIADNKKIYLGIVAIYVVFNFVLIQGLGSTFSIVDTKAEIEDVVGNEDKLGTSVALFSYMTASFNSQISEVAGTYQLVLTLVTLLATIWLTRQLLAGEKPQLRDGYYKGMHPAIPFVLVSFVICLQLVPAAVGSFLYSTVIGQGLAATSLEKFIWLLLFILLTILSLYMVVSSVFALFIVSLAGVRPMQALRSARELVLHRRLKIFARFVILAIGLLLTALLIFVPLIIIVPSIVELLFLFFSALCLIVGTIYTYNMYRSML